jgi:hypothetical protein
MKGWELAEQCYALRQRNVGVKPKGGIIHLFHLKAGGKTAKLAKQLLNQNTK